MQGKAEAVDRTAQALLKAIQSNIVHTEAHIYKCKRIKRIIGEEFASTVEFVQRLLEDYHAEEKLLLVHLAGLRNPAMKPSARSWNTKKKQLVKRITFKVSELEALLDSYATTGRLMRCLTSSRLRKEVESMCSLLLQQAQLFLCESEAATRRKQMMDELVQKTQEKHQRKQEQQKHLAKVEHARRQRRVESKKGVHHALSPIRRDRPQVQPRIQAPVVIVEDAEAQLSTPSSPSSLAEERGHPSNGGHHQHHRHQHQLHGQVKAAAFEENQERDDDDDQEDEEGEEDEPEVYVDEDEEDEDEEEGFDVVEVEEKRVHKARLKQEILIHDEEGRAWWYRNLGPDKYVVTWSEFEEAIKTDDVTSAHATDAALASLQDILDNCRTGFVTQYKFAEFLKSFGPLSQCLDNMLRLLGEPWFHGYLSVQEVENLMEKQNTGVFLIRFSQSRPGNFALAFVEQGPTGGNPARIKHALITCCTPYSFRVDEGAIVGSQARSFRDLHELIQHYSHLLVLPLSSSLSKDVTFYGDLTGEEAHKMLMKQEDGTYLFRFSSRPGYLAVSFVLNNVVEHRLIEWTPTGYRLVVVSNKNPEGVGFAHHEEHQTLSELAAAHSDLFCIPYSDQTDYDVSTLVNEIFDDTIDIKAFRAKRQRRYRQSVLKIVDRIIDDIFGEGESTKTLRMSMMRHQTKFSSTRFPQLVLTSDEDERPRKMTSDEVASRRREETNYSFMSSAAYVQREQQWLSPTGAKQDSLVERHQAHHHATTMAPLPLTDSAKKQADQAKDADSDDSNERPITSPRCRSPSPRTQPPIPLNPSANVPTIESCPPPHSSPPSRSASPRADQASTSSAAAPTTSSIPSSSSSSSSPSSSLPVSSESLTPPSASLAPHRPRHKRSLSSSDVSPYAIVHRGGQAAEASRSSDATSPSQPTSAPNASSRAHPQPARSQRAAALTRRGEGPLTLSVDRQPFVNETTDDCLVHARRRADPSKLMALTKGAHFLSRHRGGE